jgi:hypothetical protein
MTQRILAGISIFSLVVGPLLISCGVDDEAIEREVVGNWILQQRDTTQCEDDEQDGSEGLSCSSLFCSRLILSDSGAYIQEITTGGSTSSENGFYRLEGRRLQLCNDPDEEEALSCDAFEMTLTGRTLIINAEQKIDGCFVRRRYVRN